MELTALCLASHPASPGAFWSAWSLSPAVVLPLLAAAGWYVARGAPGRRWAFALGWLALAAALVSPLCRLAATTASGHMVQHVLLAAVATPLLALAMAPAKGGWAQRPGLASVAYAAAIWLSHAPLIYRATLLHPAAHLAQLALLIGASLLFWRTLLATAPGAATLMALGALLQTGMLGALLTFAGAPWYPVFGSGPALWGLHPLADQQLAGLIMWVPMGGAYLAAGLGVFAAWLSRLERAAEPAAGGRIEP